MNTKTKSKELNTSNGNAKSTNNTESLIKYEEIENTPFTCVELETDHGKEFHVVMGKYRLNENPFYMKKVAIEDAKKMDYWKIMQIINIIIDDRENNKQIKDK